jgi:hypothetical protein
MNIKPRKVTRMGSVASQAQTERAVFTKIIEHSIYTGAFTAGGIV